MIQNSEIRTIQTVFDTSRVICNKVKLTLKRKEYLNLLALDSEIFWLIVTAPLQIVFSCSVFPYSEIYYTNNILAKANVIPSGYRSCSVFRWSIFRYSFQRSGTESFSWFSLVPQDERLAVIHPPLDVITTANEKQRYIMNRIKYKSTVKPWSHVQKQPQNCRLLEESTLVTCTDIKCAS
jgi:hypothetical protein